MLPPVGETLLGGRRRAAPPVLGGDPHREEYRAGRVPEGNSAGGVPRGVLVYARAGVLENLKRVRAHRGGEGRSPDRTHGTNGPLSICFLGGSSALLAYGGFSI